VGEKMKLNARYHELLDDLNHARTNSLHNKSIDELAAWVAGAQCAGGFVLGILANEYYFKQGIRRPMLDGVWLDWSES
jgi:hypothetical protein